MAGDGKGTDDTLQRLVEWSQGHGVILDGIYPATIPGRGTGVIATEEIKEGQTILYVPTPLLRTLDRLAPATRRRLPVSRMSLHGVLAADLCQEVNDDADDDDDDGDDDNGDDGDHEGERNKKDPNGQADGSGQNGRNRWWHPGWDDFWLQVLPSLADFTDSIPLRWPQPLQDLLPGAALHILRKQQTNLAKDWGMVASAIPTTGGLDEAHLGAHEDDDHHGDSRGKQQQLRLLQTQQELRQDGKRRRCPKRKVLTYDDYVYAWLIVNSRTFYYYTQSMEGKYGPKDRLALQPIADLFNHADDGCKVEFQLPRAESTQTAAEPKGRKIKKQKTDEQGLSGRRKDDTRSTDTRAVDGETSVDDSGYRFFANRDFAPGEEVYISYGAHNNDILLAEYGFILDENRWDEVALDEILAPYFAPWQETKLRDEGYWRQWVVDATADEGSCHRTQVALRLLVLCQSSSGDSSGNVNERFKDAIERWESFVTTGYDDDDDEGQTQKQVQAVLREVLRKLEKRSEDRIREIGLETTKGSPAQKSLLRARWGQIGKLCAGTIKRIEA